MIYSDLVTILNNAYIQKIMFMNVSRIIYLHEIQAVCSSVAMYGKMYQLCNVTTDIG